MTQKELLYFEDAIEHEKNIIKIFGELSQNLESEELQEFLKNELEIHNNTKEKLINLLEEKANE